MDLLHSIYLGFSVAFTGMNLLFCLGGVLIGTLIGVLPGLGPCGAISLLLPVTFGINPASAVIMLAGIYYGSQYGGSTTSILVNIPGEASTVVTCLDGYRMARQGRAGAAFLGCIVCHLNTRWLAFQVDRGRPRSLIKCLQMPDGNAEILRPGVIAINLRAGLERT